METASVHSELDRQLAFVIDDEAEIRQLMAMTLAERGYKTQSFITAKDALVALGCNQPAVIFLDVALLQSDAIDVLIGLGAQRYGGIVNLVSGGRPELVEAVRRLGVRHGVTLAPSLNKPFGRAAIVQALAGIGLTFWRCRRRCPPKPKRSKNSDGDRDNRSDIDDARSNTGCNDRRRGHRVRCGRLAAVPGGKATLCSPDRACDRDHARPAGRFIAGAPPYVRGLCIIRGTPVPVVDAGLLISNQATQSGRLVTIRAGDRTIALQVEAVLGVRVFPRTLSMSCRRCCAMPRPKRLRRSEYWTPNSCCVAGRKDRSRERFQ